MTRGNYALCTLFNSQYLDKGLVLYDSLEKVTSHFQLYVLAMDDQCYTVLKDYKKKYLVPIRLKDFENEELLKVKSLRSIGEYCWTCSSSLIKYVLDNYSPDYCSYIDADMAFYDDPHVLIDEMQEKNASVSIVGHRFCFYDKDAWKKVGRYCVECNTFKNDYYAKKLLHKWINQCIEHCAADGDGVYWGDQKYMDDWVNNYNFVIETKLIGAGVAPWNLPQYKLVSHDNQNILLSCHGKTDNLLFYHFEDISYITRKRVKIGVYNRWFIDDNLVGLLYIDYLRCLDKYKQDVENKYHLILLIQKHPASPKEGKPRIDILDKLKWFLYSKWVNLLFRELPAIILNEKDIIEI